MTEPIDPDMLLPMIQETEARLNKNLLELTDVMEILAALRRTIDSDEKLLKRLQKDLTEHVNNDPEVSLT